MLCCQILKEGVREENWKKTGRRKEGMWKLHVNYLCNRIFCREV